MSGLPTGTITFLFTDIEGSTLRLKRVGLLQPGRATTSGTITEAKGPPRVTGRPVRDERATG